MKSLSVNAQEFIPCTLGNSGGLISPIATSMPPPPSVLATNAVNVAIPTTAAMYHDPSSPIVAFNHLGQPLAPAQITSILTPGHVGGSSIQYLNQYDLNAKLMELAANQQHHPPTIPQYSFYSEIIPSPIVFATATGPMSSIPQSATPIVYSSPHSAAQFIHNHSPSPIAHFIPSTHPPPPSLPPHMQPSLPHSTAMTIGYQSSTENASTSNIVYQKSSLPHSQFHNNLMTKRKSSNSVGIQFNRLSDLNRPKTNNNRIKKLPTVSGLVKSQKKEFEMNDDQKEWPSLDNQPQPEPEPQPNPPYIADQDKFRKVVANVQLIKNAVEQHYLNEEKKLSFKQVLTTKPLKKHSNQLVKAQSQLSPDQSHVHVENNSMIQASKEIDKEKQRRRRSKSKSKKREKSASEPETIVNHILSVNEFDLKSENFPDLEGASEKNATTLTTSRDENAFNTSYAALKKSTEKSETSNKPLTMSNGKRLNAPIVLEFANMISALEKGQHDVGSKFTSTQTFNMKHSGIQNLPGKTDSSNRLGNIKSSATQVGIRRGKETQNSKTKKKSTLKKIILREREEKKKTNAAIIALNEPENVTVSNSPVSSMHLNELFASPREKLIGDEEPYDESSTSKEDEERDEESEEEETEGAEGYEEPDQDEIPDSVHNNEEVMSNQMSPISQNSPISANGYAPSPYTALNVIANEKALLSMEKLEQLVKQKVHSRKFREYCNQIVNRDIDEVCTLLLQEIARFQDRMYHKNPNKAKMRRRYVMGIREVTKHLKLRKLKCIILAPNCEKIESKGGLDDAINFIIQTSMEQNVPFVFALGRKGLGKAVNKLVPISVIGLFDFSGAEEYFKRLVELAENAKVAYQEMIEEYEREECDNLISIPSHVCSETVHSNMTHGSASYQQPRIPSHMGHSRTPSNGSNISVEPFYHHMNYHTHSRSASGNFNYGQTTSVSFSGLPPQHPSSATSGHVRNGSGGGGIDLGKSWLPSHSRTPSNCSNISFISRLSEPISEVGGSSVNLTSGINTGNNGSTFAAVQYYTDQVRQEMREMRESSSESAANTPAGAPPESSSNHTSSVASLNENKPSLASEPEQKNASQTDGAAISASLINLHLGCIDEIDGGNEADTEDFREEEKNVVSRSKGSNSNSIEINTCSNQQDNVDTSVTSTSKPN